MAIALSASGTGRIAKDERERVEITETVRLYRFQATKPFVRAEAPEPC